ncbi:N-acetylglucosamine-6-phosphate deacetylase [Haloferula luteola]|uniref:N-acetylglucosamine-6-phosphate deacetylase n=1 Tax=Haloferula luteola TaxID=595692 RepID=A0A840V035_9BACT|nr:N-acetylglucosamine-6-phosphate deacetylase [Haloferula luteola]MBB5351727.1 N-acetylglucosamine-6-phosphate deacetylase [Haloferula luteola]
MFTGLASGIELWIHNARLVSPGFECEAGGLLIKDGRIVACGENRPTGFSGREWDLDGRTVVPGFIDLHAHGADGSDVADADVEAIRHIARRKLEEGVTTWLPTTLTLPREQLCRIAAAVAAYRDQPDFTRCPGLHVEGPFLSREKVGAQNPQWVRDPDRDELEALRKICPVSILSLAPELPGALELIRWASAQGIVCSAAHTAASFAETTAAREVGLRHLTHFGNAMTPLHHREIGVVGAGLMDDQLNLELIADGIHLSPEMLKLVIHLVGVERLMLVTDSMAGSWLDRGEAMLGGLEVVLDGRVARLKENGALAGSILKYHEGVRFLHALLQKPWHTWVAMTSWNQARSLGWEGLGKLEPGFHADLAILNDDFSVWKSLVGGEVR